MGYTHNGRLRFPVAFSHDFIVREYFHPSLAERKTTEVLPFLADATFYHSYHLCYFGDFVRLQEIQTAGRCMVPVADDIVFVL